MRTLSLRWLKWFMQDDRALCSKQTTTKPLGAPVPMILGRNHLQLHVRKNFPSSQFVWWCDRSFPKMVSSLLLSTSNQKPDKLLSGIITDFWEDRDVKMTTSKFLNVWSHEFIPRYMALEQSSLDLIFVSRDYMTFKVPSRPPPRYSKVLSLKG